VTEEDTMDRLQERVEALEFVVRELSNEKRAMERRLRSWRIIAAGLTVLALLAPTTRLTRAQGTAPTPSLAELAARVATLESKLSAVQAALSTLNKGIQVNGTTGDVSLVHNLHCAGSVDIQKSLTVEGHSVDGLVALLHVETDGTVVFPGAVRVEGEMSLSHDFRCAGSADIGDRLTVHGQPLDNLAGLLRIGNDGAITFPGDVRVEGILGASSANLDGDLVVGNDAEIRRVLFVRGDQETDGQLLVHGSASVRGDLTVNGTAEINGQTFP
jgi:cytoskeletal protein CcmA (bactofilin family)